MTTSPNPANRPAFTLLEMLLVLTILVMAASIVWPTFGSLTRRVLGQEARYELLGLLRQARWWAARTGKTCRVHLVAGEGPCEVQVSYIEPSAGASAAAGAGVAVSDDWAMLEQAPRVTGFLQTRSQTGGKTAPEATLVFAPAGVDQDTVIILAGDPGDAPGRIVVRSPSGLAWLVDGSQASEITHESMQAYWCANYRDGVAAHGK